MIVSKIEFPEQQDHLKWPWMTRWNMIRQHRWWLTQHQNPTSLSVNRNVLTHYMYFEFAPVKSVDYSMWSYTTTKNVVFSLHNCSKINIKLLLNFSCIWRFYFFLQERLKWVISISQLLPLTHHSTEIWLKNVYEMWSMNSPGRSAVSPSRVFFWDVLVW